MTYSISIKKAFGMPASDDTHEYIFKSGEYGTMYQYWYRDRAGNYYRYTNAPVDHPDFDPFFGMPLMDPEQPLPEKNPEFFTQEGYKRSMAIPTGASPQRNPAYNQKDARNLWFEAASNAGVVSYIYLDADVKENLDLYVQHQVRVVDAQLPKLRQYATQLFQGEHSKDKMTGAIMMLIDQGFFDVEELTTATVGDISFVDQVVVLLGRKLVCDLNFLDFLTSIASNRAPNEPLFFTETKNGKMPVGKNYVYAVFASLRVSPKFLVYWNASHLFSRIVNRMAFQGAPAETVEEQAFDELARTLTTRDDVRYLVDYKLRVTLLRNYSGGFTKSLVHLVSDDFGVAVIRSDLTSYRPDEQEFSQWLQSEPIHDTSPAEEQEIQEALAPEEPAQPEGSATNPPPPGQGPASPEDAPESAPTPAEEAPL